MRPFLPAFLCLPLVMTWPAFADPAAPLPARPSNLRSDILYTHKGEFVQVKPMRPLTLNAHVEQFAYEPLGIELAVVGSEPQGDQTLHFVETLDARTGKEISRFAFTAPTESQETALMLRGWSTSGKYLMLQRFLPAPNEPQTAVSDFLRWDLSASPPTTKTIDLQAALPPEQQRADLAGSADCFPSPTGRWLAFTQSVHTQADDGKPGADRNVYLLYDPERDTFQTLNLPPKTVFDAWADNSHLKIWQGSERKQFDVVTGQISPVPDTANPDTFLASKQYSDLSLDTEAREVDDLKNAGAQAPAFIVWIRRTPFGKMPLGVAAAGLMPKGEASDSGGFDAHGLPQTAWSPTGKQVAFVANGDLCVTDLVSMSNGVPKEKLAVGLPLTCAEEKALGEVDLKQIGLALIQYAQDYDEHYPPTEDIEKTLAPYLKTNDVFSVGSTHWVYRGASNVSLASIDSPADAVQATMDLPCAHLVLYFDGHVKSYPKQETMP